MQNSFKLSVLRVLYNRYNNDELADTLFGSRNNEDIITIQSIALASETSSRRSLLQAQSPLSLRFEVGLLVYGEFAATSASFISGVFSETTTIASLAVELGVDPSSCTMIGVQVDFSAPESLHAKLPNNSDNATIARPVPSSHN